MSYGKNNHLSEDELLTAMIDKDDLPITARDHLSECPQCREQMKTLEGELDTLGRMAERFSPRQRKQVSLNVKPHRAGRWFWGLGTAGATVMVALTVTLLWWSPFSQTMPKALNGVTFQETDQLMTDIDKLVDNPLPQVYLYIAGESQQESGSDSGDSADPTDNNITPSYNSATKGAVVC